MLSPEVLASHQATLELQARDEDRRAPPSEALTALEEELVQRHQRELAIAAERDRLRRELAGVGRERLDELRKAQSDDLARLDRETAARAAERAALAEEVAALERAAHVEEEPVMTARSARSVKRTLSETRESLRVRTAPDETGVGRGAPNMNRGARVAGGHRCSGKASSGAESRGAAAPAAVARQRGLVALGIIGCVAGGRPSRFVAGRRAAADAPAADSEGANTESTNTPTADA